MTSHAKVDFEGLTTEQRLALLETMLGNLPARPDWTQRVIFLAFQIAGERPQGQIEEALSQLEKARPGFFDEALDVAKDIHGLVLR